MYKYHRVERCYGFEDWAHALVLHGEPVHGGKKTNALQLAAFERCAHPGPRIRRQWIYHEVTVETVGKCANRLRYRVFIARNTGDERRVLNAMATQFLHPDCRQRLW